VMLKSRTESKKSEDMVQCYKTIKIENCGVEFETQS
jgi:hypothetical protein